MSDMCSMFYSGKMSGISYHIVVIDHGVVNLRELSIFFKPVIRLVPVQSNRISLNQISQNKNAYTLQRTMRVPIVKPYTTFNL